MVNQRPAISVIILDGRTSQHVAETLCSALEQKVSLPFEILVAADPLARVSQQVLARFEAAEHARIIENDRECGPNQQLAVALNQCHGQYIALLKCGDFWTENSKLQQQVEYLEEHSQCSVCYHRVRTIHNDGCSLSAGAPLSLPHASTFNDLVGGQSLPVSTLVIRRGAITPLPRWFERLKCRDWPLCLLATLHGDIGFIDKVLAASRLETSACQGVGYRDLNSVLTRIRREARGRHSSTIETQLAEHHRLIGLELDHQGRGHSADRHRRLCFLYGGWQSRLPLRTKISHAIRPYKLLSWLAATGLGITRFPRRFAPILSFTLTTLWRQPSTILVVGNAVINDGIHGLSRQWRILDYLYGVSRQRYHCWIRRFDTLTNDDRTAIRFRTETMKFRPQFSIILPLDDPSEGHLKQAVGSVIGQLYPDWELYITSDRSIALHMRGTLNEFQEADVRIRCRVAEDRESISTVSNRALEFVSGDYVVVMNHDDVLTEHALYMVAEEINRHPGTQVIYSDQDRLNVRGQRVDPYFKTDWNPDLMLSHNLICHLSAFRCQLVQDVGGFRAGMESCLGYDLALRCIEPVSENLIRHIPAVLCHWRQVQDSVTTGSSTAAKSYEAGAQAIREHLARQEVAASVEVITDCGTPHYRVRYALPRPPLVTVIIPTRDRLDLLQRCVDGLLHDTDYPNLEIMIIDNESSQPATLGYFASLKQYASVRILEYRGAFNYSSINNFAVEHANGEVICLLNNDTEIIHADWLLEMVSHAMREEVGAVGAKLLYPNDTIQHAGVLIGSGGLAKHAFSMLPVETPIQFGRAETIQDVSCVTAACLVMKRSVFDEVGGLDERLFAVAYNDVDLCLKIVSSGYRIVWTPYAQLYHHESASRGRSLTQKARARERAEGTALRKRWSERIAADPNLNPNLSTERTDYRPAFPPRVRKPWS